MNHTKYSSMARKILGSVSYFAGLDENTMDAITRTALRRTYDPNQVILIEGEPSTGLYVVETGWLKVTKISTEGREQVLQTLGPGDTFNAVSVFTGTPNQASVVALEQAVLWWVPRDEILRLLEKNPTLARLVIQDLAGRVIHLIELVEDLSLRSVEARLARLLLEHARDETLPRRRWATQAEMAARLGTVPDVLNRAMRKLAAEGLIQVARHQIQIIDRQGLAEIAQIQ
ncbi:MAG: Crp/Fnr family transcriptional regulator [Anaerolineales bacterium]|nr:Crp/Fnr family transcriptional regulator [Anaerolineales bacterium]